MPRVWICITLGVIGLPPMFGWAPPMTIQHPQKSLKRNERRGPMVSNGERQRSFHFHVLPRFSIGNELDTQPRSRSSSPPAPHRLRPPTAPPPVQRQKRELLYCEYISYAFLPLDGIVATSVTHSMVTINWWLMALHTITRQSSAPETT